MDVKISGSLQLDLAGPSGAAAAVCAPAVATWTLIATPPLQLG
jgi:hypothetical protein